MSYNYAEAFLYHEWDNNVLKDIYLPEPIDEKQKNVIENIKNNYTVSMDFDSHSAKENAIFNLLHYFLGKGKKVLFVSSDDKTSSDIINRIPKELECFYLNKFNEKNYFIKGIIDRINTIEDFKKYDIDKIDYVIQNKFDELNSCKQEKIKIQKGINEFNKLVNIDYKVKGKKFGINDIKKWVKYNEDNYSWIEDTISIDESMPMTEAKFSKLVYLFSNIKKDEFAYYLKYKEILNSFVNIDDIICLVNEYKNIKKNINTYIYMSEEYEENASHIVNNKKIYNLLFKNLRYFDDDDFDAINKCLINLEKGVISKKLLNQKVLKINYYYKKIRRLNNILSKHEVQIPKDISINKLQEDAIIINRNIKSNDNLTLKYKLFHSNTRYFLETVTVDGENVYGKTQIQLACKYIEKIVCEKKFNEIWKEICDIFQVNSNSFKIYKDFKNLFDKAEKAVMIQNNIELLSICFMKVKTEHEIDWYKKETYINLINGINGLKKLRKYKLVKEKIEKFINTYEIDKKLSMNDEVGINDDEFLNKLINELNIIKEINKELVEKIEISIVPLQEVCPLVIDKLINEDNRTDMLIKYRSFSKAWLWAKFNKVLNDLDSYDLIQLTNQLKKEIEKEKFILKSISFSEIWKKYLTNQEKTNIKALNDLKIDCLKLSNTKFESEQEYKEFIRHNYEKMQKTIPMWIMNMNEANEYIKYRNDNFDIVIFEKNKDVEISSIISLIKSKKVIVLGSLSNNEKALISHKTIKEYTKGIA